MISLDAFSPDYGTARERFRETARRVGWCLDAFPIGQTGPHGEDLTIDVSVSPATNADKALVVSSGLHGVEGSFGSAVQLTLLEGELVGQTAATGTRAVLIHALNPFGFAWSRRTNEDKRRLRELFCPEDPAWRRNALKQGLALIERVIVGEW
jgi:hypothetical protein